MFGAIIVAIIQKASKRASRAEDYALKAADVAMASAELAHKKLAVIERQTATNGTSKELGLLTELIHQDTRDTKNAVRRLERKVDRHHSLPVGAAHPEED